MVNIQNAGAAVTLPTNTDAIKVISGGQSTDIDKIQVTSGGTTTTIWEKQKYYYITYSAKIGRAHV